MSELLSRRECKHDVMMVMARWRYKSSVSTVTLTLCPSFVSDLPPLPSFSFPSSLLTSFPILPFLLVWIF